jgi:P-type Ca2+ transporter type 2C
VREGRGERHRAGCVEWPDDRQNAIPAEGEGYNELPHAGHRSLPCIAFEVVREPIFGLLIGAGVVYLLVSDPAEAVLLLVFASLSIVIAVVQESRSERMLETLRDLTPR